MIILLLLLALLGGTEDPPYVLGGVVTGDGPSVPPTSGLPGPPPSDGGLFQLEGHHKNVRIRDRPDSCRNPGLEGEHVGACSQTAVTYGSAHVVTVVGSARLGLNVPAIATRIGSGTRNPVVDDIDSAGG